MLYKRILLKISGEMLSSQEDCVFDYEFAKKLLEALKEPMKQGVEIALVVGSGNIYRGREGIQNGISQVKADQVGMLATVLNALLLQELAQTLEIPSEVFSAVAVPNFVKSYSQKEAFEALKTKKLVILGGGTGNPYFTTDSGAALRALELQCDVLLKATKVDGVYDKDPMKYKEAVKYDSLSFDEVLEQNLSVMDMSAFALCRDYHMPIRVFSLENLANISTVLNEKNFGTLIHD